MKKYWGANSTLVPPVPTLLRQWKKINFNYEETLEKTASLEESTMRNRDLQLWENMWAINSRVTNPRAARTPGIYEFLLMNLCKWNNKSSIWRCYNILTNKIRNGSNRCFTLFYIHAVWVQRNSCGISYFGSKIAF